MPHSLTKFRIGTRASKLALTQVAEVKTLLLQNTTLQESQIEIIPITTSGDKIQDRNLSDIGGKGLFIKELEEALLAGKIDIAIHSAKDVPPIVHAATQIAAFTQRKDARDYFISNKFSSIEQLPMHATVGTSSARRKAILLRLRPDLKIINFRGNVDTRLGKLAEGQVDATILALCGLNRLEKKIIAENIIPLETMLPAAGQGCLAIQVRQIMPSKKADSPTTASLASDEEILKITRQINDAATESCANTERSFLRELGASCKTPVAAYCNKTAQGLLNLRTIIFDFDGSEIFASNFLGDDGKALAMLAANEVKAKAAKLLAKICA